MTLGENKGKEVVPGITRWGFESYKKGQLLINARAETVEEKKTFSQPFRESRCVFPMSGFYEWNQDKEKVFFSQKEEVMYVAGFYRIHKTGAGFESESIIMTTAANSSVSPVHDRMPLVLAEQDVQKWISNLDFARSYLTANMPDLSQIEAAK